MEYAFSDRALKRLPQIRLKFIDGYISSYYSILKSTECLEYIRQANKLTYVLCDLESDCIREKEEKKKRSTEAVENRRRKSEENQVRKNKDRLRGIEICVALVHSVLKFGMDHINNLKFKELWVLL